MATSTRWRLNITERNGTYIMIGEVEMRGSVGGADLCTGGTASASSTLSSYTPDKAFADDGTLLDNCWVTNSAAPQWIEYAFASAQEILEYTIQSCSTNASYAGNAPVSWTLQYFDGSDWITVDEQSGQTGWAIGEVRTFSISALPPDATRSAWLMYTPRAISIEDPEGWAWRDLIEPVVVVIPLDTSAWIDPTSVSIPAENWAYQDTAPSTLKIVVAESWAWKMVPPATHWALPTTQPRREVFICLLRKTGLSDVEVPMASMQMRRRDGNPTMVSCVIPDAETYLDYAEDREDGEIIIYAGSITEDGTRHLSELERASLDSISYDIGVQSSSLTIAGYRTETNTNPKPVDIMGVSYYGLQADGKRRIRGKVNQFLRPGDTAIYNGESFVVDQVYISVEATNAWMEAAGL